jgi:hypothetical protein
VASTGSRRTVPLDTRGVERLLMMGEIASIPPALHALAEGSSGRVCESLSDSVDGQLQHLAQLVGPRSHTARWIPHV